jgi:hypothetical protein
MCSARHENRDERKTYRDRRIAMSSPMVRTTGTPAYSTGVLEHPSLLRRGTRAFGVLKTMLPSAASINHPRPRRRLKAREQAEPVDATTQVAPPKPQFDRVRAATTPNRAPDRKRNRLRDPSRTEAAHK